VKKITISIFTVIMMLALFFSASVFAASGDPVGVTYSAHVENIGWQAPVSDGAPAGTTGLSLRMEAVMINLDNAPAGAVISYEAHVQNIGWQPVVENGDVAGTAGMSLRLEALKINLENMPGYSVQYRTHVENIGWQDWVSDGAVAGTTGQSLRAEAVEIKIVQTTDLTAYEAALAAVTEADYTTESWDVYQAVAAANVVTMANTQAEVDAATAAITAAQANLVIIIDVSAITVTGDAVVGATLTAAPTPGAATGTYQWKSSDSADGQYANITDATSNTYVIGDAYAGKFIKVTFTASGSYTGTQTSVATTVVAAALGSDATLKASSTIKGETLLSLGTPSASGAIWSNGGTVTITAAEAVNTTNLTPYITLFDPTDAGATVKVVKYAQWSNVGNFDSAPAYANQAITNQDYFWVKVTAPDTTTLYYKVNVTVTPTPVSAITVTGTGGATTVTNGSTLQMSAAVTPTDATDKTVTWSVAPTTGAGAGTATIDATTGVLTGTGNGTVVVTATANNGIKGNETITVVDGPQAVITNVHISSNNADVTKAMNGDTITLTFTASEAVTKLSPQFKINGSNPDTFTNVGLVYTATHLVDSGDAVTGEPATFQINVMNAAGIYSPTVEATTDSSSVTIIDAYARITNVSIVSDNATPVPDTNIETGA